MQKFFQDGYDNNSMNPGHPADQYLLSKKAYSAEFKTVLHSPLNNNKVVIVVLFAALFHFAFSLTLIESHSEWASFQRFACMIPVFVFMYFAFSQNEMHQEFKKLDEKYADLNEYHNRTKI